MIETAPVRYRWYVLLISASAALGGLLFGYDWVVIGGAKPFYEAYFRLTSDVEIGWANSCALLGCLMGSLVSGVASDQYGRKKLLIGSALLFGLSSLLTAIATSFGAFVLWRITGGVAIGIASNVSPMYIAEVSPARWRGRLVSLNQLTIVFGILLAQIVNWLIAEKVADTGAGALLRREVVRVSWNGQYGWRWMFGAVAVPSLVFLVSSLLVPESPRWLLGKKDIEQARRVLARIGGPAYAAEEVAAFLEAREVRPPGGNVFLLRPQFRRAVIVGVVLAALQQWSGINILFNYAEEIYRSAGYGVNELLFNIVITGAINVVCTLLALAFVDSAGRRRLMAIGCGAVGLAHLALALAYRGHVSGLPILLLTLCAIGAYAMSLAPIT